MSIPDSSHPVWAKLANGSVPGFAPKQLALQLLFTRLGHEVLGPKEKAQAIQIFFVKYEKILSAEITQLKDLRLL